VLFGIHDFINSQPILDPLLKRPAGLDILTGSPAQLADQLSDGELDLAMIPAIEYLKQADRFRLLPNIAIASRNKVGTVLLISKLPIPAICSLAVDDRSRTSVALLKVLYSRIFPDGLRFENQKPDPKKMLENHDAALIIGDQALGFAKESTLIYDLSEEWFNLTGKTFVHAVIAVREGIKAEIAETIIDAKRQGLQNLDAIARTQANKTGHSVGLVQDYLKNKIRYGFGEEEMEGLLSFQSLCYEAGLISKQFPLKLI
jgi:chorismate dehydratase